MSSKRELTACAERLLSLMEVPDGVELEETMDMVLIDLQMHIVDSGTRSAVASVLADRVFALLMQTFIAHYPEIDHEYVTIFYAYNHVFETEMYDTADLPRVGSIGGKLKRMQEEFDLPRNYEEWVLYFRYYKTYCEMLSKRGNVQMKVELRRTALPYLAEVCGHAEELSKQEQRAIVIAQTISCMGPKEIGNALLLLNTCQGQLFGFVPEQLGVLNAKELRTVFGILCEVVRLAPAEFYFPLTVRMERKIYKAVSAWTGNTHHESTTVLQRIWEEKRWMKENGKQASPELTGLLKLHRYYMKTLNGDGQPEWDEL